MSNIEAVNLRKQTEREFRRNRLKNLIAIEGVNLFNHSSRQVRLLARSLDCSPRTIWRDLQFLMNQEMKSNKDRQKQREKFIKTSKNPLADDILLGKSRFEGSAAAHHNYFLGKSERKTNGMTNASMPSYNTNLIKPLLLSDGWKFINLRNLKVYNTIREAEKGL